MCSYYLGPIQNAPTTNLNNNQPTRLLKKTQESEFEKALKTEDISKTKKNTLENIAKIKKGESSQNISNVKVRSLNSMNHLTAQKSDAKDGTNLALKKLTDELAEQVVGILMNYAMNPEGVSDGGFAESIYRSEANVEIVKDVAKDLIDDLSQQFYEDSLRVDKKNEENKTRKISEDH